MRTVAVMFAALALSFMPARGAEQKGLLGGALEGLSLDFRTVEDTDGGIAVDFQWHLLDRAKKGGYLGDMDHLLSAKLDAKGMIGSKSAEDDNTPRTMSVAGNLDFQTIYMDYGGFDYKAWLGVTAVELEADQNWKEVNYVFRPFVRFDVPYSREVSKALRWLLGTGTKDYVKPVVIGFGYSLVSKVESDPPRSAENRFEVSTLYQIETYKSIRITGQDRFFSEGDRNYNLIELTTGFPVQVADSHLTLKYVKGKLPLSLRSSSSLSVGWSVSL